jgi:uncharacterized repeat protein (TIGR04076 family)
MIEAIVHEIRGFCNIGGALGDKLVFDGVFRPDLSKISYSKLLGGHQQVCSFALINMFPFVEAMSKGVSAVDIGIAKSGKDGYVGCQTDLIFGKFYHGVIYRLHQVPIKKSNSDAFYETAAKACHLEIATPLFAQKYASQKCKETWLKQLEEWEKAGELEEMKKVYGTVEFKKMMEREKSKGKPFKGIRPLLE